MKRLLIFVISLFVCYASPVCAEDNTKDFEEISEGLFPEHATTEKIITADGKRYTVIRDRDRDKIVESIQKSYSETLDFINSDDNFDMLKKYCSSSVLKFLQVHTVINTIATTEQVQYFYKIIADIKYCRQNEQNSIRAEETLKRYGL